MSTWFIQVERPAAAADEVHLIRPFAGRPLSVSEYQGGSLIAIVSVLPHQVLGWSPGDHLNAISQTSLPAMSDVRSLKPPASGLMAAMPGFGHLASQEASSRIIPGDRGSPSGRPFSKK